MINLFPTIDYSLISGQTLQFVDIFKTVNIEFKNKNLLQTTTKIIGERPDQLSYRLYQSSNYYWSLFLTNNIKNPFKEWGQSEEAFNKKIEKEYEGFVYQFANNSKYLPPENSYPIQNTDIDVYTGVDFSNISAGDLIMVETGEGSYSIKCLGAGIVVSTDFCGDPQRGQSIVPDDLDIQKNIKQVSCGGYFSSCLDTSGRIYAWGKDIGFNDSPYGFLSKSSKGLYKSISSGFTFINASGDRIIAIKNDGGLTCFGDCSKDFSIHYDGDTGFVKTYWTKGLCGGIGIKNDGTVKYYGITGPNVQLHDADCGLNYCVGVLKSNFGLTGFGGISPFNEYKTNFPSGITGFTGVAAGLYHNIAINSKGGLCGFGISAEGRTIVPNSTSIYKTVSAGRYHSAALDQNNKLVTWGSIATYLGSCVGTETKASITNVSGTYSLLDSGFDHLILRSSGTVKRYIGVINSVDTLFKKINVKSYQYSDINPLLTTQDIDPSGSVVSIWRYNQSSEQYEEIKTIQNKLLTIQKYLDGVLYIKIAGNVIDPSVNNNFKNIYLPNYKNADDEESFDTLRKQLTNQNIYNTKQIKYLSNNGVQVLENTVSGILNGTTTETTVTDVT